MDRWLSYDQVALVPNVVSSLEHRSEADTSVQFGPLKLSLPLIAAPMPDVTNVDMALKLCELSSFGWIHRFQTHEEMIKEFDSRIRRNIKDFPAVGVAISANTTTIGDWYDRGVRIFCLDTANGANKMVERTIKILKDGYPDIFIVAGNVAHFQTFFQLQDWGADAIRVGIAGGSVCETRTETGIYSPMATAIKEIHQQRSKVAGNALLIADGGIRTPGDMCKAIALGADLVMAGRVFAGTKEAPGSILKDREGKLVKILRGAASFSVQNGQSEYIEGAETFVDYQGKVEKVISRFAAGLRSSMSYMNAVNLAEYRYNTKIVEVA